MDHIRPLHSATGAVSSGLFLAQRFTLAPVPREVAFSHWAAIGSIRLGSLFLTLPTRALTGQHIIASDG
jgi:hypothetical protein